MLCKGYKDLLHNFVKVLPISVIPLQLTTDAEHKCAMGHSIKIRKYIFMRKTQRKLYSSWVKF